MRTYESLEELDGRNAESVFEVIYSQLRTSLTSSVRQNSFGTCVESEIEDIVQESFVQLWQSLLSGQLKDLRLSQLGEEENLIRIRVFLYRCAKFKRIQLFHVANRRRLHNERQLLSKSHSCEDHHLILDVERVLDSCSRESKQIFLLRQQGFSFAAIAEKQGVNVSTVRVRYHRTRKYLRERLLAEV